MSQLPPRPNNTWPVVAVVGAGFGGLACAKRLKGVPANVVLLDRTNHHLFQPLLYQVATATLSPSDIAAPVRKVLARNRNAVSVLAEVTEVDPAKKLLYLNYLDYGEQPEPFDYLVIATGSRHSYFGKNEFAVHAPGLKTLADATSVRARILRAFEKAEIERDPKEHQDLLTFVLVGGGPTGVEMAGAIAELCRDSLARDFRRIQPAEARIILIDGGSRILSGFDEKLSDAARRRLIGMGIEVITGRTLAHVDEAGVLVGGERIAARTVIWTAGVEPSPAGQWLNAATDRSGRVKVNPDLSIAGHPDIFVIGDTAYVEQDGKPLPAVAQVALQQGKYVADLLRARIWKEPACPPFRYRDMGSMAVIGRGYSLLQYKKVRIAGWSAWIAWALIHVLYLAEYGNRVRVLVQWAWTYFTGQGGSRLIVDPFPDPVQASKPEDPA